MYDYTELLCLKWYVILSLTCPDVATANDLPPIKTLLQQPAITEKEKNIEWAESTTHLCSGSFEMESKLSLEVHAGLKRLGNTTLVNEDAFANLVDNAMRAITHSKPTTKHDASRLIMRFSSFKLCKIFKLLFLVLELLFVNDWKLDTPACIHVFLPHKILFKSSRQCLRRLAMVSSSFAVPFLGFFSKSSKGDVLKESHCALLTLLVEVARQDFPVESLTTLLEAKMSWPPSRAAKLCKVYSDCLPQIQASLCNVGFHPPHIVDVQWTLHHTIKVRLIMNDIMGYVVGLLA